ncbi:hypothetical protein FSARC_14206 [Fusarium sarcochroum]|uniref:Uncharacterized protein n=1 Tax=Fusarium sarcochroum TaxID=1208366 RepID=A0A8H4WQP8_9HYPO|nr:hypothetical protein FSARC_14206 [Fusarium sarcochroum]
MKDHIPLSSEDTLFCRPICLLFAVCKDASNFPKIWETVTTDRGSATGNLILYIGKILGISEEQRSELSPDQQDAALTSIETRLDGGKFPAQSPRQHLIDYSKVRHGISQRKVIENITHKGGEAGFQVKPEERSSVPSLFTAMCSASICGKFGYRLPEDFTKNRTIDQFIYQVYETFNPHTTVVHKWFPCELTCEQTHRQREDYTHPGVCETKKPLEDICANSSSVEHGHPVEWNEAWREYLSKGGW